MRRHFETSAITSRLVDIVSDVIIRQALHSLFITLPVFTFVSTSFGTTVGSRTFSETAACGQPRLALTADERDTLTRRKQKSVTLGSVI